MEEICRAYWYPLFAFARGMGLSPPDAEDATQELFANIIAKNSMSRLSPNSGKVRSYLIASLRNWIRQDHRRKTRMKRGGGAAIITIDQREAEGRYQSELSDGESPEQAFERRWAVALLEIALERLRKEYEDRGEKSSFDVLNPLLVDSERGKDFRAAAEKLSVKEGTVRVAVFRLRKRYRSLVREEVAETVANASEIDEEINALFAALGR